MLENTLPPAEWKKTEWIKPTDSDRPDWEYVGRIFGRVCSLKARISRVHLLSNSTRDRWLNGGISDILPYIMDESYVNVQWNSDALVPEELLTHTKITKCVYDCGFFHTAMQIPRIHGFQNIPWLSFTSEVRLIDPEDFVLLSGKTYSDEGLADYLDEFPLDSHDTPADIVIVLYDPISTDSDGRFIPVENRLILAGHSQYVGLDGTDNTGFSGLSVPAPINCCFLQHSKEDFNMSAVLVRNGYMRNLDCIDDNIPELLVNKIKGTEAVLDKVNAITYPMFDFDKDYDTERATTLLASFALFTPAVDDTYFQIDLARYSYPVRNYSKKAFNIDLDLGFMTVIPPLDETYEYQVYRSLCGFYSINIVDGTRLHIKLVLAPFNIYYNNSTQGWSTVDRWDLNDTIGIVIKPCQLINLKLAVQDLPSYADGTKVIDWSDTSVVDVMDKDHVDYCAFNRNYIDDGYSSNTGYYFYEHSTTVDFSAFLGTNYNDEDILYVGNVLFYHTGGSDIDTTKYEEITGTLIVGGEVIYEDNYVETYPADVGLNSFDGTMNVLLVSDIDKEIYVWCRSTYKYDFDIGTREGNISYCTVDLLVRINGHTTLIDSVSYLPELYNIFRKFGYFSSLNTVAMKRNILSASIYCSSSGETIGGTEENPLIRTTTICTDVPIRYVYGMSQIIAYIDAATEFGYSDEYPTVDNVKSYIVAQQPMAQYSHERYNNITPVDVADHAVCSEDGRTIAIKTRKLIDGSDITYLFYDDVLVKENYRADDVDWQKPI